MGKKDRTSNREVGDVVHLARRSCELVFLKMGQRRKRAARVYVRRCSMQIVRSGLGDLIKYSASRPAKFSAEVCGLDIDLLYRVGIGDRVRWSGYRNVVILHSVDH